jgi:hypothetical protein
VFRVWSIFATLLLAAALPAPAPAQTLIRSSNLEVSIQNQLLRGAILSQPFTPSDFLRDYRITEEGQVPSDAYLAVYTARWYGYRVEDLSTIDLALEGVGTGATMGMFLGAVGHALGLWDEDKAWLLVGAMSALGGAWGASKADDPTWRYRLRWDEEVDLTVPKE